MLCRRFAVTQSDATPKRGVLFERYLVGFAVTQSDATPKQAMGNAGGGYVLLLPRVTLLQNIAVPPASASMVLLLPRVTLLQNL